MTVNRINRKEWLLDIVQRAVTPRRVLRALPRNDANGDEFEYLYADRLLMNNDTLSEIRRVASYYGERRVHIFDSIYTRDQDGTERVCGKLVAIDKSLPANEVVYVMELPV